MLVARDGADRRELVASSDSLPTEVLAGRSLFYAATDRRIAAWGLSCAGCHPDGRDDGLTWFLRQGPRQTPSLSGRLVECPRCHSRDTADLLSCRDLVEIMRHRLPTKIVTDEDLAASIIDRHRRRHKAMESAYRKQAAMLSALD